MERTAGPGAASAPRRDGARITGGVSDALRAGVRGKNFSEGEAFVRPRAGEHDKGKARVELGAPEMVELRDVPRGHSARVEALAAQEQLDDGGLGKTSAAWDRELGDSALAHRVRRDRVEALYLAHVETPEPQGGAFQARRAERSEAMLRDVEQYGLAASLGGALRVSTAMGFAVVGQADRDFRGLGGALQASGRASIDETGRLAPDAPRIVAEDTELRTQAREQGRPGTNPEPGNADLLRRVFSDIQSSSALLTSCSLRLRRRDLRREAAAAVEARSALQQRLTLATELDAVVTAVVQFLPKVSSVLESEEYEQEAVAPSGLFAAIVAREAFAESGRLTRRIAGLKKLVEATDAAILDLDLGAAVRAFEADVTLFVNCLGTVAARAANRRDDLAVVGRALDSDARERGELAQDKERFEPIALRQGRLETAHASNAAACTVLGSLAAQATAAGDPIALLMSLPTSDKQLHDLRLGIGVNVPHALGRRITRLHTELLERDSTLENTMHPKKETR